MVKNLPVKQEMRVQSLGGEDPLQKDMTTHSSILSWEMLWAEELGRLQFMGSQKSQARLRGLADTQGREGTMGMPQVVNVGVQSLLWEEVNSLLLFASELFVSALLLLLIYVRRIITLSR